MIEPSWQNYFACTAGLISLYQSKKHKHLRSLLTIYSHKSIFMKAELSDLRTRTLVVCSLGKVVRGHAYPGWNVLSLFLLFGRVKGGLLVVLK